LFNYPPVYAYNRGVLKDIEYAGYRIPAGWLVTISPMLTHRLPELYTDPDRFDPDRFAPPREEDKKHPLALMGFGHGSHRCLGMEFAQMEMKIVLSTLLRHCDWTVKPDYSAIAPNFAVELRSASDSLRTVQQKMQEYIDNGVRLGWLINPQNQQVEIYRPGQEVQVLRSPTSLSGEDVLAGFVLDLAQILS